MKSTTKKIEHNAIFPGSFDPIHEGHIDIIKRASKLFDNVFVAVSFNIYKKHSKTINDRFNNTKITIDKLNLSNVKVVKNEGLTIDAAKKYNCKIILRSIRDKKDAICEKNLAQANSKLDNSIETVLLIASKKLQKISSKAKRYLEDTKKHYKK